MPRLGELAACVAVAALLAASRPAEAEMWTSSLGDLLRTAKTIEIVKIDQPAPDGGTTHGRVTEVVRSAAAVGDPVGLELGDLVAPVVGDRVLVICDDLCPRAAAIDHDGVFVLAARELGDGGVVMPNLVLRRSLDALAAGRAAPDLCLSALVALADEPGVTDVAVIVNATTGRGTATVDGHPVAARLWPSFGRGIGLQLDNVELMASGLRGDRGCLKGPFVPVDPVPRRRASFVRALAHRPAIASVFARGVLTIGPDRGAPAGTYPLELAIDGDGSAHVTSKLVAASQAQINVGQDHLAYDFSVRASSYYPALRLIIPAAMPALGTGAAAVRELAYQHKVIAQASWVREHEHVVPLGEVALTYIPE
jgi:hypothetical protein